MPDPVMDVRHASPASGGARTLVWLLAALTVAVAVLIASSAAAASEGKRADERGATPPERFTPGGSGDSAGPVVPVEGPDGLLWLCREDEEKMQSICIPWFPPESGPSPIGAFQRANGGAKGPVVPVEDPDGLLWLCREDEEEMQSICIPWFQDIKPPRFGIFDPRVASSPPR